MKLKDTVDHTINQFIAALKNITVRLKGISCYLLGMYYICYCCHYRYLEVRVYPVLLLSIKVL